MADSGHGESPGAARRGVVILRAGGRDFHDFNTVFRNHGGYEVVAFTAAQIPLIDDRLYPPGLAGRSTPTASPSARRSSSPTSSVTMTSTRWWEATIRASGCDVVVNGSPARLSRLLQIDVPIRTASYELREIGHPDIADVLAPWIERWRPTT